MASAGISITYKTTPQQVEALRDKLGAASGQLKGTYSDSDVVLDWFTLNADTSVLVYVKEVLSLRARLASREEIEQAISEATGLQA